MELAFKNLFVCSLGGWVVINGEEESGARVGDAGGDMSTSMSTVAIAQMSKQERRLRCK